jgi:hypothetical protein
MSVASVSTEEEQNMSNIDRTTRRYIRFGFAGGLLALVLVFGSGHGALAQAQIGAALSSIATQNGTANLPTNQSITVPMPAASPMLTCCAKPTPVPVEPQAAVAAPAQAAQPSSGR